MASKRPHSRPRRRSRVTREQLLGMAPAAILQGIEDGTLHLPVVADVNNELPPGAQFVDVRGVSFRQFLALNGMEDPGADGSPEDWVAWFMDAGSDR